MTEPKDAGGPMGKIAVGLASDSMFLTQSLPVEVRDSNLRLVKRATGAGVVDVPVGLYEVSAVLGDGQRHSAFIDVKEGAETAVQLGSGTPMDTSTGDLDPGQTTSPSDSASSGGLAPYQRSTYTEANAAAPDDPEERWPKPDLELIEVTGASVVEQKRTKLSFQCNPAIDAVPTAVVAFGGHRQRVSLPISPQTATPSGGCVVKVDRTPGGFHAQAWISPERRVANGLQNMLSTGYVLEAAQVADEAVDLLRGKYEDPAGAALGALLLHKAGLLARWETWVENLAHDFPWLPDGRVLLTHIRVTRGAQTDEDLRLLVAASEQRVLYAETCSLLIDLLRRWPEGRSSPEHQAAIERLTTNAPDIDRDAICLTVWIPSDPA
jgi:hypothetical protein